MHSFHGYTQMNANEQLLPILPCTDSPKYTGLACTHLPSARVTLCRVTEVDKNGSCSIAEQKQLTVRIYMCYTLTAYCIYYIYSCNLCTFFLEVKAPKRGA